MTPTISEEQREQRRLQILQAAIELFLEQGYEKTSVSDIVRKTGIAQGTFYLYYPGKEHLLHDLAGVYAARMVDHTISRVSLQTPPLDRIAQAIYALADYMQEETAVIGLFHTATAASLLREPEAMAANMKLLMQPLVDWIEEGINDGSIRKVNPQLTAHLVFTLGHEVLEQAFLTGSRAALDAIIPGLIDFITAALRVSSR